MYMIVLTDMFKNRFTDGKRVANLENPTNEFVQTITLPKDTKARFVTLDLGERHASFKFREVEIYNEQLLGNSKN